MKLFVLGDPERIQKYMPEEGLERTERTVLPIDASDSAILEAGRDAEYALIDAITPFGRNLIEGMPRLRLIQSEGVAYNRIDLAAAREHGIYVCNQKGANAAAVAEHTVMLMLALLKYLLPGYQMVREGKQIETKSFLMLSGIHELSEMKIGLYGFGDIGTAVAKLLVPFGSRVYYTKRHPLDRKAEEQLHATFLPPDELLSACDIVSMHVPASGETTGMCDAAFFAKMKIGALFLNTSRGELVDNNALCSALISGKLAGAGLDTIAPEPVQADHPLLHLPDEIQNRVLITPHIAGVTTGFFHRAYQGIWNNICLVESGQRPEHVVNGL